MREFSSSLCPVRIYYLQVRKWTLTKNEISCHLDFELPSHQNCEK
jgi:hypothetical protein